MGITGNKSIVSACPQSLSFWWGRHTGQLQTVDNATKEIQGGVMESDGGRLRLTRLSGKAFLEMVLFELRPTESKEATKREGIFERLFQAEKTKN